jgi:hypothetical protein
MEDFSNDSLDHTQWGRLYDAIGDATNAFTTYGMTAYFHTIHKSALEAILSLEVDRMKNITLTEDQFEKEKKVVMSELTGNRNHQYMRLYEKVMEAAYGPDFWPGRSIGGDTVMDLTRQHAMEFYLHSYRPGCLTATIVGDISWEELVQRFDQLGLADAGIHNIYEFSPCVDNIPVPVAITLRPGYNVSTQDAHKVIMREENTPEAILMYVVPLCKMTDIRDVAALQVSSCNI